MDYLKKLMDKTISEHISKKMVQDGLWKLPNDPVDITSPKNLA